MKARNLSELEQRIMTIVWEYQGCSVRDVLQKLKGKKKLAYTTVATILNRLGEKGLVKRIDDNFIIHYSPRLSKEDYTKNIAKTFIDKYMNMFGDIAIASFAESIEDLPKKKKDYFLKLLEKQK